jgi:hypothetical protein
MTDLKVKRDELTKLRDQHVANANFIAGQIALLDELLATPPVAEDDHARTGE